jgi:hypothetical protein
MTPPIDLLDIASARKHEAWVVWQAAGSMQSSFAAAQVWERLNVNYLCAERDLYRVHALIQELSE